MWELNYHTPRLLAERGFRWDPSLMDADYPYLLQGAGGAASLPLGRLVTPAEIASAVI